MGVKELWSLVSPTGELLPLTALEGKAVAIDLSCWVVDCQALNLGHVARPHLRNLFFRTMALLNNGVLPVFVLEGDAPIMKWNTINSRNQRNFHSSANPTGKNLSVKTGKRSRFKSVLKECRELLDLLGVPWVQASGEAEATCAALNYHNMVEGVISQDSDVFLYGGQTVFRNFTANQSKATVEKFSMDQLEQHLKLTRGGLLLLAILLGCDYFPAGVQGVGKDTAVRLLRIWYQKGVKDPVRRMQSWAESYGQSSQHSNLNARKWKNGNDDELEVGVRDRVLATDGFPFTDIIQEFQRRLDMPLLKVKWGRPRFSDLVRWCIIKLEWEGNYAVEKISPVVTRWMVTCGWYGGRISYPDLGLMPLSIVKRCVRRGVSACQVKWKVLSQNLPENSPVELTTDEPLHLLQASLPALLEEFEEAKATKKGKGSKKSKKNEQKKTKAKDVSKEKTQVSKKKEEEEYITPEEEEENTDEDLSLIIERLVSIDLTGRNKNSKCKSVSVSDNRDKSYKETVSKEGTLKEFTLTVDQKGKHANNMDEETKCADELEHGKRKQTLVKGRLDLDTSTDSSDENDKENQPLSLMDRISRRIGKKDIRSKLKASEGPFGAFHTKNSNTETDSDSEKESEERTEKCRDIVSTDFTKSIGSSEVKSELCNLTSNYQSEIPSDNKDFKDKLPEDSLNFDKEVLEHIQNFEDEIPENCFDFDDKGTENRLNFEDKLPSNSGKFNEKGQEDSLDYETTMDNEDFDDIVPEFFKLDYSENKTADCLVLDKILENVSDVKGSKSNEINHESQVTNQLAHENKKENDESQRCLMTMPKEELRFTLVDFSLLSETSACKNQISRDMFDDTGEVQGISHSALPDLNSTPVLVNSKGILRGQGDSKAQDDSASCSLQECKPLENVYTPSPTTWKTPAGKTEGSFDCTVSPLEPLSAKSLHRLQDSRSKERRFIHLPRTGCNSTPLVNTPKGRSKDGSYGLCFKLLDTFSCSDTGESFNQSAVEEIAAYSEVSKVMENSLNLLQDSLRGDISQTESMFTAKRCANDISILNEEDHDKPFAQRMNKNPCYHDKTDKAGITPLGDSKKEKENQQLETTKGCESEKQLNKGKISHQLQVKEDLANTTFSPAITGLSLAQRIKMKCKDRAISKLIDDL
ncbi:uncharacterized protein LOC125035366 [Penaeus chinensis]|uniref:uncharacterized protein LOC125035366 n=1 Tax=Penaeus chinensis TaxID=139456 RepID=UPI001FB6D05A|nr:uncharacterized protein LOC125035366 [Penaeus chinensis]